MTYNEGAQISDVRPDFFPNYINVSSYINSQTTILVFSYKWLIFHVCISFEESRENTCNRQMILEFMKLSFTNF